MHEAGLPAVSWCETRLKQQGVGEPDEMFTQLVDEFSRGRPVSHA